LREAIGNGRPEFVTRDMIKNVKDDAAAIYKVFPEVAEIYRQIRNVKSK
jgi:hypothetical protein